MGRITHNVVDGVQQARFPTTQILQEVSESQHKPPLKHVMGFKTKGRNK